MSNLVEPPDSYQALCHRLSLNDGIPLVKDWSAAADFLQLIVDHVEEHRPELIVECSSGLTTLMLARACQLNQKGRVVSLENGEQYADKTRQAIDAYGLNEYATVLHAPLVSQLVDGKEYQWYTLGELVEFSIDMLVIDGPIGNIQKNSRYPALPLLRDYFSDNCHVFMDDAARPDERKIIELWNQSVPGIQSSYIALERGCARLNIVSSNSP
ncbi:MAG: class I SAM-dependent methyltransferase [Gammaproteobacteria bacterium]|nr:class I SAM-dependent methyltransferase [Gammaproteobacteria bacterium]